MLPNDLLDTLLNVIEKYVFFAEDPTVMKNFTKGERFIMDNYAGHISRLLQQVGCISIGLRQLTCTGKNLR